MTSESFDREAYEELSDALAILSAAKQAALYLVLDAVHNRGIAFDAIETYRWVANAYDHLQRQQRVALGLERRGDPCLPSW